MEAFPIGPFDYTPGKSRMLNGVAQTEWALCYGGKLVGSAWVAGDRAQVVEALAVQRGDFVARLRTDNARDCLILRRWDDAAPLLPGGLLKYVHCGEYHAYNPDVVRTRQQAVQSGEYSDYQQYAKLVNERPAATLRDLLALNPGEDAISIDEVEPAKELFKRFDTAAMSIGAMSPEAH